MSNYQSEIEISTELVAQEASYYQSLIGILQWILRLGRVDINVEVSMMLSCMALPQKGHLDQFFNIFAYLKIKHNSEMVFDPSEPNIKMQDFYRTEWDSTIYSNRMKQHQLTCLNHKVKG